MMAALLAGVNSPSPTPIRPSSTTNNPWPGWVRPRIPSMIAVRAIPVTVSGRAPKRSTARPASGATAPRARGITVSSRPTRAALSP